VQLPLRFRALSALRHRVVAALGETPLVFFAVVVGVALLFKVGVGLVKGESATPEPVAISSAAGATPKTPVSFQPDPAAQPLGTSTTSAGAGATPIATATATPPRHHRHHPRSH
jgi:hypothetical protein